jgi:hypothetical protein
MIEREIGCLPRMEMYEAYWSQVEKGEREAQEKVHPAPHLRALQRRFFAYLRYPEGVEAAEEAMRARDPEEPALTAWIEGEEARARLRMGVYGGMYFYRLLDVLRGEYPRLAHLMGEGSFHNLVMDYLLVYPSMYPTIQDVGARLADFLRERPRPDAPAWLPSLAALERTRDEMICAADAPSVTQGDLAQHAPECWGELRFAVLPAHRLRWVEHPIHPIWMALRDHEQAQEAGQEVPLVLPEIEAKRSPILVWRKGFSVLHEPLNEQEARGWCCLCEGQDFNAFCESFLVGLGEGGLGEEALIQEAISAAYRCFSRWLAEGLFSAIITPDVTACASASAS